MNIKGVLSNFHVGCCSDVKRNTLSFLCFQDIPRIAKEYNEMGKKVIKKEVKWLFTVENIVIIKGIVKKALMKKAENPIEEYKKSKNGWGTEKNEKYKIDAELKYLKEVFKNLWKDIFMCVNNNGVKIETDCFKERVISHKEILGNLQKIFSHSVGHVLFRVGMKIVPQFSQNLENGLGVVRNYFATENTELNKIDYFTFGPDITISMVANFILLKIPQNIVNLRQLKTLTCTNNLIRKLFPLDGLQVLQTLNLSYNRIEKIDPSIGNLVSLERIYLQGNCIKEFPDSMENLINLTFINICENPFERFPLVFMSLGLENVQIQIEKSKLRGLEYRVEGWTKNKDGEECVTVSPKKIAIKGKK